MRGEYDAHLQWPFKLKVTFSLIDQSTTNDKRYHIDQFCWPDSTDICFQRPTTDMNTAYGISRFCLLDLFRQKRNCFVQNDTIFIKVEVDLLSEGSNLPLRVGAGQLPSDDEHVDTKDDDLLRIICRDDAL
ncbi:unnamed protein product [Rotaria sp. Silwood1]|nr:unnamed protein product [Rotaria sp. Silwood1]CAF5134258.1 unnamed protein product [Rotaria sp. Silwood1]